MVENKGMKAESVQELEQMPEVCSQGPELKPWNEMTWEGVREEYPLVVDIAFETNEGINYLPKMYDSSTIERAKLRCVEGLEDVIDSFREEHSETAEPKDLDWPLFLWRRDNKISITKLIKNSVKKRLDEDIELKNTMESYYEQYAGNISVGIAQKYIALVTDRNNVTY